MKIVTILFALLIVAGCYPLKTGTSAAISAGHAAGSLEAAHRGITAALPHTDSIGKANLADADGSITVVLNSDIPEYEKTAQLASNLKTENAKLKSEWVSPKMRGAAITALLAFLALVVLLGVLKAFASNPIVSIVYSGLVAVCTIGGSIGHNAVAWLVGKIK